ncbi:MAG: hypothetical protein ACRETL_06345, partial [Gammaproteobacteria bacterium]
ARPDDVGLALLRRAAEIMKLSARGYHRTLKVARTIADLDGKDVTGKEHVAEALSYRRETLSRTEAGPERTATRVRLGGLRRGLPKPLPMRYFKRA